MLMNRLYTLNSFSSQLYFNNNANSIILKKSGCLFVLQINRHMQIMLMNRLYTLNSFSSELYFNNNANTLSLKSFVEGKKTERAHRQRGRTFGRFGINAVWRIQAV